MLYGLLIALTLFVLGLIISTVIFWRKSTRLETEIEQLEQRIESQLKSFGRRMDNYLTGSMQMGEELYNLRQQFAPLPDKLLQMEQRDPSVLSFTEAARLVSMGATVDDLQQSCGLTVAEAELLQRMHRKQK